MTIWFTSDTHFGHANMMKFSPHSRPFRSVDEMNDTIIRVWNEHIQPNDIVYHLGDFAFKGSGYFQKLNGIKHLIKGNHDHSDTRKLPWQWMKDYYRLDIDGKTIVLFHYPIDSWDKMHHGSLHVHGHIHSTPQSNVDHHGSDWHPTKNRFDVGWDYYQRPVKLSELLAWSNEKW